MRPISESKRLSAYKRWTNALEKYDLNLSMAGEPFRRRWVEPPGQFSNELSVASEVLSAISNTHTTKSSRVVEEKVRRLVSSRDENQYLLTLSELEVPALLACRVSPIAFEPAVPVNADSAKTPPSSDHSISMPSGEILVEATTLDLRHTPNDSETVLRRLKRKLGDKRHQSSRDCPYVLAIKVLGPLDVFHTVNRLVIERIWPNPQFRRYGGILGIVQTPEELGIFQGTWLPNRQSEVLTKKDVDDLFLGHRCFHLMRVNSMPFSGDDVSSFRKRVAQDWHVQRGISIPARLVGGPLDDIEILLKPTELGDQSIGFLWDIEGRIINHSSGKRFAMPPHGPLRVAYRRQNDTIYEFEGYSFWINEWRPKVPGTEYLLHLSTTS